MFLIFLFQLYLVTKLCLWTGFSGAHLWKKANLTRKLTAVSGAHLWKGQISALYYLPVSRWGSLVQYSCVFFVLEKNFPFRANFSRQVLTSWISINSYTVQYLRWICLMIGWICITPSSHNKFSYQLPKINRLSFHNCLLLKVKTQTLALLAK